MTTSDLITGLLQFQQQIRLFHWMTESFAEHKAFGEAYEALDDQIDELVESFIGKFGRETPEEISLKLKPYGEKAIQQAFLAFRAFLASMTKEISGSTELLNMRDGILGEVDHLIYRLTFN
jgi:DNA-binding ferritin-like protein